MQNCCSYNYYCTTIVFTPLSAEEEKKKYYLIEMSWVRETDRKKQDWSYSISYQHYRQYHLYHYHHIMLKIKEQKMMIISSFIIKSNGSRLRKKRAKDHHHLHHHRIMVISRQQAQSHQIRAYILIYYSLFVSSSFKPSQLLGRLFCVMIIVKSYFTNYLHAYRQQVYQ